MVWDWAEVLGTKFSKVLGVKVAYDVWGSQALLLRPVAEGEKLFRWREVFVLMECSLPEGSVPQVCCVENEVW